MRKIATTSELQSELRQILAYASSELPSRSRIAGELKSLGARLNVCKTAALSDEQKWNICLGRAGDKKFMHTKRSMTVVLSDRGTELARKDEHSTRGKVTQVSYSFTKAADKLFEDSEAE